MVKTAIIVLLVLGILAICSIAYARHKGYCHGPEGRVNWLTERVTKQLNLDDQQQQQLNLFRGKLVEMRDQLHNGKSQHIEQALQLLNTPQLDRKRAYQLWDEKQQKIAAAGPELIDSFANFSDSLNDEQRKQLQAMITEHQQHPGNRCCTGPHPAFQH